MAYVYMVRCQNGSLYTGWTNDLARRISAHKTGKGAKYTRAFGGQALAYAEITADRSAALKREAQLKKLTKQQKESLTAGFDPAAFLLMRPAVVPDAPLVQAIYAHYVNNTSANFYYQSPTVDDFSAAIRTTRRTLPYILLENAKGEVLGYACAHPWRYASGGYAWDAETTIYLAPDKRRQGGGKRLYNALLACLAIQGYWNAYGVLADPNPESEAFHVRFGFECQGRQPRCGYKNRWLGISYWGLALKQGTAAPEGSPRPLTKQDYEVILPAACSGLAWQQIVALHSAQEQPEKAAAIKSATP